MSPVKAKFENMKLFTFKIVERQDALSQSLAAPLMAKAEEQGTQLPSVAENYIITLESPHNKSVSWALPQTTGPAAQYQCPLAAFIIVLDIVTHPVALGTVQLMTPFV